MLNAEIILDTRYKGSKGYSVKIRVYPVGSRSYKYIPLKIYQSGKTLKITKEVAKEISRTEERLNYCNNNKVSLANALEIFKNGLPESKDLEIFLLKKRLEELQKISGTRLIEFFDIIIQEKKDINSSFKAYYETKQQLINFLGEGNDVLINNVDYEWLKSFILYKKKFGKGKGGVNFYLKQTRAVYKEAQRRESLHIKKGNPFIGLIKNKTERKVSSLKAEEIKKLFDYTPKKGTTKYSEYITKRNINIWLFQFCIGGHDYADIANLKWDNIVDGRISFKRFKNRNKEEGDAIDNMLPQFALNVIKEYGSPDSERVFSFIPDPLNEDKYNAFRNRVVKSLQRVKETLKLRDKLSTKTSRYLFRSFSGELLIDVLVIMQIQGHKPEGITYQYQRRLPNEVIDKEHKKVLELIGF